MSIQAPINETKRLPDRERSGSLWFYVRQVCLLATAVGAATRGLLRSGLGAAAFGVSAARFRSLGRFGLHTARIRKTARWVAPHFNAAQDAFPATAIFSAAVDAVLAAVLQSAARLGFLGDLNGFDWLLRGSRFDRREHAGECGGNDNQHHGQRRAD